MKTVIVLTCLLLATGDMWAQNMYMAVQQAKRESAKNDAEQQRIQNAAGGAPGAPAAAAQPNASVDPALQATLSNIAGLQTDFAGVVASGNKADPAQKTSLLNNLSQAAQGTKASADAVKKVADDLVAALAGQKRVMAAQQKKLAADVHALFNSSHLSDAQQKKLLDEVQKILTDAGASLDNAVDLVTDLKGVVAQTK